MKTDGILCLHTEAADLPIKRCILSSGSLTDSYGLSISEPINLDGIFGFDLSDEARWFAFSHGGLRAGDGCLECGWFRRSDVIQVKIPHLGVGVVGVVLHRDRLVGFCALRDHTEMEKYQVEYQPLGSNCYNLKALWWRKVPSIASSPRLLA